MILGLVGPEGSGKSVGMTYLALKNIAEGGKVQTFPGYTVTDGKNHQLSQPLQTEDWITMSPELRDTLICIDEIQNFVNSMKHMSTINYLFANLAAQRRHRNLGILYTVQDWGWLDNRVRWLTHVLVTCYDLYWSQWGKENQVKRGELISMTFYDVKGFHSGQPWTAAGPFTLRAKPIWDCFNSFADVDMFSGLSKIDIKKPKITIDLTGELEETKAAQQASPGSLKAPGPDVDSALLNEVANIPGIKPQTLSKLARRLISQ